MLGVCAHERGNLPDARRWVREARALTDDTTLFPIRALILAMDAWFAARLGHLDDARASLVAARSVTPPGSRVGDYVSLSEALVLAMSGYLAQATERMQALADELHAAGVLGMAAECLQMLFRLAPSAAAAVSMRQVADASDSPLFAAYADFAEALADGDADRLTCVGEVFEQFGYLGLAVEAAAAAAAWATRAGRARQATNLAHRVRSLSDRCGGDWWARRCDPVQVCDLTRRERQLCELAADGLTNIEIAERLVLSVRTVENHLQHAYQKLGVRGRTDLASVFGVDSRS
jgi:DNA-binding CsgD family transcriptional regulator